MAKRYRHIGSRMVETIQPADGEFVLASGYDNLAAACRELLKPMARVANCVPDNWNDANVLIWEQMSANTIRINCLPPGSCDGVTLKG